MRFPLLVFPAAVCFRFLAAPYSISCSWISNQARYPDLSLSPFPSPGWPIHLDIRRQWSRGFHHDTERLGLHGDAYGRIAPHGLALGGGCLSPVSAFACTALDCCPLDPEWPCRGGIWTSRAFHLALAGGGGGDYIQLLHQPACLTNCLCVCGPVKLDGSP